MKEKRRLHIIAVTSLLVLVVLGLACASSPPPPPASPAPPAPPAPPAQQASTPRAPTFASFGDSTDRRFVGDWRGTEDGTVYYRTYNADGTGVSGRIFPDGTRTRTPFTWRASSTWTSELDWDGTQRAFPYSFDVNATRLTFQPAIQIDGRNMRILGSPYNKVAQ